MLLEPKYQAIVKNTEFTFTYRYFAQIQYTS